MWCFSNYLNVAARTSIRRPTANKILRLRKAVGHQVQVTITTNCTSRRKYDIFI